MAFRFTLKHAKNHALATLSPIRGRTQRGENVASDLSLAKNVATITKRSINTSGRLGASGTSSLRQASMISTVPQSSVDIPPYPFQPGTLGKSQFGEDHLPLIPNFQETTDFEFSGTTREPYWQKIPWFSDVPEEKFLSYQWQMKNTINRPWHLFKCLENVLPDFIPHDPEDSDRMGHIKTREDFIRDVQEGMQVSPMAVRLTPHVFSVIDWSNPISDPVRRQFIPMKSSLVQDHPELELDSLHESDDSPVPGLVHRYPDKALFISTSVCPVYCRFCTRSYSIGTDTPVNKKSFKGNQKKWEAMFGYIEQTPALSDIVVSGGDSYHLLPEEIMEIGERLLAIPHIRRFRFATKGLAVCPSRIVDENDLWSKAIVSISNKGKKLGKEVAVHTHFNHPNEITWVTRLAAQKLFENGVRVRNQSVLLRRVNDDVNVMKKLIRELADNNITPYYVYQGDMVKGVEDLRTPLQTILEMESQIQGTIAGHMVPKFIVDLPGGGGKRLASTHLSYNRQTGVSTFKAPAVSKNKGDGEERIFKYYDPLWSLEEA